LLQTTRGGGNESWTAAGPAPQPPGWSAGPRRRNHARFTAWYIDRILEGAKPRDLPIEQPRWTSSVSSNLRTA